MKNAYLSISTVALLIGLGTTPALANTVADDTTATSANTVSVAPAQPTNTTASPTTQNSMSPEMSAIDHVTDRDVMQEKRIEQGLQSGSLTPEEAARLERGEGRIDKLEKADLSNGQLSTSEAARLQQAQNAESLRIYQLKHNNTTGDPNSEANKLLGADVQRNINQQTRIDQGVDNGSLTANEVGKLEGGQARIDHKEAGAGRDGTISTQEQARIQQAEGFQSGNIYNEKHDDMTVSSNSGSNYSQEGRGRNGFDHGDDFRYGDHDNDRDDMQKVHLSDRNGSQKFNYDRNKQGHDEHRDMNYSNRGVGNTSGDTNDNISGQITPVNASGDTTVNGQQGASDSGTSTSANNASSGNTSASSTGSTSANSNMGASSAAAAPAVAPHLAAPLVAPHVHAAAVHVGGKH